MKDRIANALCTLAAVASLTFVACLPAADRPPAHPAAEPNVPGCLWEWTAFGWILDTDNCMGMCRPPADKGTVLGQYKATPCVKR